MAQQSSTEPDVPSQVLMAPSSELTGSPQNQGGLMSSFG